jgi:dinuclear metal center YbgI/SA1388 family protein
MPIFGWTKRPLERHDGGAMPASLARIVHIADRWLHSGTQGDFPGALNGLQLENNGRVTRMAAAVDAHMGVIDRAVEAGADLLVVHHGIGWSPLCPVTGARYRWLKQALDANLAIYSSHLPLDAHPTLGNNILLAKALGLRAPVPFFEEKGGKIGRIGAWSGPRSALAAALARALGGAPPLLLPGGPERVRRVAIVTGGAGNHLAQAAAAGADTFITGEGNHWTYGAALELGINVFHGGHYHTETFGVKALAAKLSRSFRIPWTFLDVPTGL